MKPGASAADVVAAVNQGPSGFPYGKAELPAPLQTLVDGAAAAIKALPSGARLEIAGYTDAAGDPGAEIKLSQDRAEAVRDALVKAGAAADALVAKGYGPADPIAGNDTDAGRLRNNRIEFHVLGSPPAAASQAAGSAQAGPAQPAVAAAPSPSPASRSTLVIEDDDGTANVSGAVPDDAARAAIMDALKAAFGADKVTGDIAVEAGRAPPPWLAHLRDALETLKVPGLKASFNGAAFGLGGSVSEDDRERIAAALASALGGDANPPAPGQAASSVGDIEAQANAKAAAAVGALKPGASSAADVVAALNLAVVNFATDSAEVPERVRGLLSDAAADLKALPEGVSIEVAGYTDSTGDAALNQDLSQRRADAVRKLLIEDGAPEAMLVAKGYGAADPVASNDTEEGRFRNRRIEYHVLKAP